jgi:hypothetical protein
LNIDESLSSLEVDMKTPLPGCGTWTSFSVKFSAALLLFAGLAAAPAQAADHRIGLGAHFWKTVDEIVDDGSFGGIEDDGYAFVLSYRYAPGGLIFFQIDIDYYADGYGGSTDTAYTPMGFIGVGRDWYIAAGVGLTYTDDFTSDHFYVGRIGWDLDLLPGISIDINASYEIDAWKEIDQLRSDATTLGAVIRFTL